MVSNGKELYILQSAYEQNIALNGIYDKGFIKKSFP